MGSVYSRLIAHDSLAQRQPNATHIHRLRWRWIGRIIIQSRDDAIKQS